MKCAQIMKICYIQALYNRNFSENIISELVENHNNVVHYRYTTKRLVAQTPELPNYSYFQNSKLRLRSPFFFKIRIKHAAKVFVDWLSKNNEKPNVLYTHFCFSDGYLAYKTYLRYGIPYVLSFRNEDLNAWYYWKMPNMRNYRNQILQNASAVIFINASYAERLYSRLPNDLNNEVKRKSNIITNGIEEFWHEHRIESGRKLKSGDTIRVLTVGDIDKNKNQKMVIDAIGILAQKKYDIKYTVVGKIRDTSVAKYIGRCKNATMLPYAKKEQLVDIYNSSDIFVMPSKHETFGLTYIEAMTQGLPVIYSKGEGISGLFPEGYIGYGVDNNDPWLSMFMGRV